MQRFTKHIDFQLRYIQRNHTLTVHAYKKHIIDTLYKTATTQHTQETTRKTASDEPFLYNVYYM